MQAPCSSIGLADSRRAKDGSLFLGGELSLLLRPLRKSEKKMHLPVHCCLKWILLTTAELAAAAFSRSMTLILQELYDGRAYELPFRFVSP